MHHTRRTFNSVQIYRRSLSFPLCSSIDDNFVMVRIKQRTCVKSSKTASATLHITFTHTNMCITYKLHKQTCCIAARSEFGIFYCWKKHATLFLSMHVYTYTYIHTPVYIFQVQTADGLWTYPMEHIRQFYDCVYIHLFLYPWVPFILFLHCCCCYDYFRHS